MTNILTKLEQDGFTCEVGANVGTNDKIDMLEFCVYGEDKTLLGFDRHYFKRPVSYKGKIVKDFLGSKEAMRCATNALFEAKLAKHADSIKAMDPPTGYTFTSDFHAMRHAGFYKTAPNCSYQPGMVNCANISIDFDGSCWLQLTDGYTTGEVDRFETLQAAVDYAESRLGK